MYKIRDVLGAPRLLFSALVKTTWMAQVSRLSTNEQNHITRGFARKFSLYLEGDWSYQKALSREVLWCLAVRKGINFGVVAGRLVRHNLRGEVMSQLLWTLRILKLSEAVSSTYKSICVQEEKLKIDVQVKLCSRDCLLSKLTFLHQFLCPKVFSSLLFFKFF